MEKVITKLKDPLSKREKELGKLDNEIKQLKGKIQRKEGAARSICAMVDETKSVFIQININSNIHE